MKKDAKIVKSLRQQQSVGCYVPFLTMKFVVLVVIFSWFGCNQTAKWNCHELGQDLLCLPSEWTTIETDKVIYFSSFEDTFVQTFFVLNRIGKDEVQTIENYLLAMHKEILNDTVEITDSYNLYRLILPDRKAYYGEFITYYHGQEYIFLTMLWMNDDSFYDMGVKVQKENMDIYYKIFQKILFKFQTKGKNVFNKTDELEFEPVSFDELNNEKQQNN